MNNKYFFTIILTLLTITAGFSQQAWSLDDCVSYALSHNLQLKDFEYNKDSGKETYRQSFRNLLPTVDASSNYFVRYGRSIDPNNNAIVFTDFFSNNYSVDANLDLFRGFQKLNTIKASKLIYKATQEEVLQQKYLLAFRVMAAFYDIQFMEGLLEISKEQVEVSQTNYNLVKRQVELGQRAGADLYEAESALLADKLLVTQNENTLKTARLTLMQEMNLKEESTIEINSLSGYDPDRKAQEKIVDQDSIFTKAKEFIPIVKAQELRAKAAKKQLAAERGNLYPSLRLFAGYGTGFFETNTNDDGSVIPFNTQITDNASQFVGVALNIPISNGWSARSRVKQQKVELMRAENNYEVQKQELFQLIQQLVQEGNALQTEFEQSEQRVKSQELSFKIGQKRYEKGLINAIELNQAKNLFATAQNENLQVKLRLKVNKSTLDFYNGLPVFNIDNTK
ncbi:TolC family protein [Spongiivirga citrea]|uniref:TolC family protein n=1 Tax=Spongiivirga citrea TaxID=1481457 RepID=A0A6M0CUA5_9FLAO|nr:TolC family protein [Spongiivirga citrea]NER17350.1 TolC family protein [Spongiivirga citrea]